MAKVEEIVEPEGDIHIEGAAVVCDLVFDASGTEGVLWKVKVTKVCPSLFGIFFVVNKVKEVTRHRSDDVR